MLLDHVRSAGQLLSAYALNKRYPLSVSHIITTRCNLRCSYCNMWKHEEKEMTTEQVKKMIDEFTGMGMRRYGITGGEPLLRSDIGEVVSHARKKGNIVTLFTNGFFVKKKIDELKDLNVLLTSFDGPKEMHDMNRQKGSYDKALEGIVTAREKGIPVWVGVTLTKNNIEHMPELFETARDVGFKLLIQPIYDYQGYSAPKDKVRAMSEFGPRYRKAVSYMIKMKKRGYPLLNSYTYLKHMKKPFNQGPNTPCWASRMYCAVTPGGRVSPCYMIYNQKKWPNGVDMGFKKAFFSLPENPKCGGCYCYNTVESNLFYKLNPEVVYNTYFRMIRC